MTTLSKAAQKVHDYRDAIHVGKVKVQDEHSSAVAYMDTTAKGHPVAVLFSGRKRRPTHFYVFKSESHRNESVNMFFKQVQATESKMRANRSTAVKQDNGRDLQVGDVLKSVWGCEQTNVFFYQVIALVGKTMVEIQEIKSKKSYPDQLSQSGTCIPVLNKFKGQPFRKKVKGKIIKLNSYARARLMEPIKTLADGTKVFKPVGFLSYA